jgi:hypothetical protein
LNHEQPDSPLITTSVANVPISAAKAGFSESAATDQEEAVQTGNECPPGSSGQENRAVLNFLSSQAVGAGVMVETSYQDAFLLEGRLRRILTGMNRWYLVLIAVLLGLVMLAYLLVRLNSPINFASMWSWDNQAKNTRSDVGKMPALETDSRDILALRRAHQLRALTEREDGIKIQDVPNGTYGFSMCSVVSLSTKRVNTSSLEIHKHHDGIVYYVGYASDEDIGKYLARPKNFHILTYPHSWEKASSLYEIPVDFVSTCEARPFGDGYLFDFFVTSIPELQS